MSVYKNNSTDALKDYHEVRDYILGINKAVQNVFNSLDPDDNFTEEELNLILAFRSSSDEQRKIVTGFLNSDK